MEAWGVRGRLPAPGQAGSVSVSPSQTQVRLHAGSQKALLWLFPSDLWLEPCGEVATCEFCPFFGGCPQQSKWELARMRREDLPPTRKERRVLQEAQQPWNPLICWARPRLAPWLLAGRGLEGITGRKGSGGRAGPSQVPAAHLAEF